MIAKTKTTRRQVEEIMGRLDDLKVAKILQTDASAAEVLEANRWTSGYKRTLPDDTPLRPSIVDTLCDIIRADEPDWYDQTQR